MSDKKQTVQDEAAIITLEFDDGEVIECEEMGIFDYDGKDYIALIPLDGSDDVYIMDTRKLERTSLSLLISKTTHCLPR